MDREMASAVCSTVLFISVLFIVIVKTINCLLEIPVRSDQMTDFLKFKYLDSNKNQFNLSENEFCSILFL